LNKPWSTGTSCNSEGGRSLDGERLMHRRTSVTRRFHGTDEAADAELRFLRKAARSQESSQHPSGVRMERVNSIRAATANGCYTISSADLAQKLMDYMLIPIQ
jgi:anti-sigma28 factor (negative regulator of flagellin synthesis)